jgi:hypothetical protein
MEITAAGTVADFHGIPFSSVLVKPNSEPKTKQKSIK